MFNNISSQQNVSPNIHFISHLFQLSFDFLESWLDRNPDAAGFKRDGRSIFRELALFQDYHGLPAFKKVNKINE